METIYAVCAVIAVCAGLVLVGVHMVAYAVATVRHSPRRPEWTPMGYIGVGLALAMAAFYLARGVSMGDWGRVHDLVGLIVVLGAASYGYGAAYEWWVKLELPHRPRWVAPLGMSVVTGMFVGLSAGTLGI